MNRFSNFLETGDVAFADLAVSGRSLSAVPMDDLHFKYDDNGRVDAAKSIYTTAYMQLLMAGGFDDKERDPPIAFGSENWNQ